MVLYILWFLGRLIHTNGPFELPTEPPPTAARREITFEMSRLAQNTVQQSAESPSTARSRWCRCKVLAGLISSIAIVIIASTVASLLLYRPKQTLTGKHV